MSFRIFRFDPKTNTTFISTVEIGTVKEAAVLSHASGVSDVEEMNALVVRTVLGTLGSCAALIIVLLVCYVVRKLVVKPAPTKVAAALRLCCYRIDESQYYHTAATVEDLKRLIGRYDSVLASPAGSIRVQPHKTPGSVGVNLQDSVCSPTPRHPLECRPLLPSSRRTGTAKPKYIGHAIRHHNKQAWKNAVKELIIRSKDQPEIFVLSSYKLEDNQMDV